jgi:hypothetical protein
MQQLFSRTAPHRVELSNTRVQFEIANDRAGAKEIVPRDLSSGAECSEQPRSLLHEMTGDPEQRVGAWARARQQRVVINAEERTRIQTRRVSKLVRDGRETRLHSENYGRTLSPPR